MRRRPITHITVGGTPLTRLDTLAGEEPLEIRVGHAGQVRKPLAVTMRTPGDELDLALGYLFTEGIIRQPQDVQSAMLCSGEPGENTFNVVDVVLAPNVSLPDVIAEGKVAASPRTVTSACGVCGKASIDAIRTRSAYDLTGDPVTVSPATLAALPERLALAQRGFTRTGGSHAAALFSADGELIAAREDVGRHNAVDKLVGRELREGRVPLAGRVLLLSGRAGFELVQKAWMAGVSVVAAVGAPSTLAADLAAEAGMTLVGFLRPPSMNVYTGGHRISAG
ncbi:formate dehydrogenase accessory sulfurtransferase FdhD [Hamadaea sp. NPDC050747]|uniref:formate dehydrogenase accessory sulfurtransferase FdhD n=1 Tax=Hamadaea sp. NPDC050747 TaxID=3155789 RepID=UPI003405E523